MMLGFSWLRLPMCSDSGDTVGMMMAHVLCALLGVPRQHKVWWDEVISQTTHEDRGAWKEKRKKRKVFVMGTGDPRCEYSAFYGQGRGVGWLRLVSCAISSYCVSYCLAGKARVSLVRGRRCVRGVSEVHSGEVVYHAVMGQTPLCGVCNREILL